MAIYHLTAKTGSRSGGQSARAKADYIQREGKYARDMDEVLHAESGHMPEFVERPADYWDAADLYERANGRLFKEVEFALPVELTLDQQKALASEFAQHLTGAERLPYTLAIHAGGGENPHCHLMISERINDGIERPAAQWFKRYNGKTPEKGGAQKTEALKHIQDCIERLWKVSIIAQNGRKRQGFRLLSEYASDEADGRLYVALNPLIAQAVMGGGQHVRISMDEVRALDSETARLLHQRLCGWIDPGKTGKASIDTLCGYVWPSEASGSTMRKRRQRVREALPELVALGWTVTEFAAGKYDITRPKAAG